MSNNDSGPNFSSPAQQHDEQRRYDDLLFELRYALLVAGLLPYALKTPQPVFAHV